MNRAKHLCAGELESGLGQIRDSPQDSGIVKMIVQRPAKDQRAVVTIGELDTENGLLGDNWRQRGSSATVDGSAHPDMQINIMNARVVALVAGTRDRWPLAGDQIYVDLDLGKENLPAGTKLQFGTAVLEVNDVPHAGCKKFAQRFGVDATKFVNSGLGKELRLRGINARVVQSGSFKVGDIVRKVP